jgi:hypothetical protein
MEPDPRHARPAPKGPDPFHWWAVRLIGVALAGIALALYFSGALGPLPVVARQFLTWALFVVGLLVLVLGWLIPWLTEG